MTCHCLQDPDSNCCAPTTPPLRCQVYPQHDVWRIALIYPDNQIALMGRFPTREDAIRHARLDGWPL